MNTALKNLIKTEGWKEAEKIILAEIASLDKCSNIDHAASNTVVARETRARAIAADRLRNVINKIRLGGSPIQGNVTKRFK